MSRYTNITNDIWYDKEFRELSHIGKLLYLYILTSPQNNQSGFYRLPIDCIKFNLGEEATEELLRGSSLYQYDQENEVVLIPNYLKYNTARSSQQLSGVVKSIYSLPYCSLMVDFVYYLVKYSGEHVFCQLPRPMKDYILQETAVRRDAISASVRESLCNNI